MLMFIVVFKGRRGAMLGRAGSTAGARVKAEELVDTDAIYRHATRLKLRPPVTYRKKNEEVLVKSSLGTFLKTNV
jgi:hypothetical protein